MGPNEQPVQRRLDPDEDYETPGGANSPQTVYVTRPINPVAPYVTDEARALHEESRKKYPFLNLTDGEYVISAVRRHPIGLIPILGGSGLLVIAAVGFAVWYASTGGASAGLVAMTAALLSLLFLIFGYIGMYVYVSNRFFLTNESVIQEIQTSLFAKREQTVSLANIEDASYHQSSLLQQLFNYGNIRLSTEGDETTYRFS